MPRNRLKTNPAYRVPDVTVFLGTILDLDIENDVHRYRIDHFEAWNMLVPEAAETTASGRGRIYLLTGKLDSASEQIEPAEGGATYEIWTGREPEKLAELETPADIGWIQGRVTRIGYRSDRGAEPGIIEDYDHYFIERGGKAPLIYTDEKKIEDSTAALIVGGDFVITNRGIE